MCCPAESSPSLCGFSLLLSIVYIGDATGELVTWIQSSCIILAQTFGKTLDTVPILHMAWMPEGIS